MGRTARFEQIYVANLDAEPVEQETLTGVKSILTREIEANEILLVEELGTKGRLGIANTLPTKSLTVGTKFFVDETDTIVLDLKGRGKAERFFVENQLAIGTTNPTKAFQIDSGGSTKVAVDVTGRDLMTVSGNLVTTNVIVSDRLLTSGANLSIQGTASNVITVIGGTKTSNLSVGSNISLTDQGSNVARIRGNIFHQGYLNIIGNIAVTGNITVTETATYIASQDLRVANVVIHAGFGNDALSRETAIVMTPGTGYSNVAVGFVAGDRGREMAFFQTDAYGGYNSSTINVDTTKVVNVHVYGDIYTANNIGAHNTYPTHDLCVGSNVFFDDRGSNVMYANGNVYAKGLVLGPNGIRAGNLLVLDPTSATPVTIAGNVQTNALRTNGTTPSGISNLAPTDTLSIGASIFANTSAINTLRVLGNTSTTNLVTEIVFSSSNLIVHADRFGGDSTSNVLILRAGPTASNVSAIEVYGASTSNTHQNIRFKTRNTERVRITSGGRVGIANTNPTEALTVAGNIYVIGSNTTTYGNIWGSTGNTAMRVYSRSLVGENKIENIVGSGKGLKIYASTTPTMGTPKLSILESSNVGINVDEPIGRLHTSGGTVFLNDQPTYRNGYSHLNSSLVVTNTQPIVDTTDLGTVMHLAREGNATRDGVRATFKMSKYDDTSGASKARLGVYLSEDDYTDENIVLTLQGNQRVGIGTTQPTAHLEVFCTGIANPTTNGLLVHNHESPRGDAIVAMQSDINQGNAFTSYIQSDADSNPVGWTVGVTRSKEFRITQNTDKVYDPATTALYIDGSTRDVGIGTDAPRAKLEVNGNVVIGQQLSFGGLSGDEYSNTHLIERRYNTDYSRTELLIFKGNDASSVDEGPDRIRHIAGEHVFQTYTSSGESLYGTNQILADMDGQTDKPLVICDNGLVVVGGQRSDADARGANTKLVVNGDVEFSGGGSFKLTGIELSTTSGVSSRNIIRNLLDSTVRRPLTFVHEIDDNNDSEFARFDGDGNLGIGTASPSQVLHTETGNFWTGIFQNSALAADNSCGIGVGKSLAINNTGEVKFYYSDDNSTSNRVSLGLSGNGDLLVVEATSNVGVGTVTPATKFHVYDGIPRVESSSSSAVIEIKTTAGTANIYSDTTGNVFINPTTTSKTTHVNSDLQILGDVAVGGNIDLGNQVAIGLSGEVASTDLEVGGGIITNSTQVACKRYSKTFSVGEGVAKDVQLIFGTGAFYAKVVAILRRTDGSTVKDLSTMILELQGGTGNGTASTLDVAIGTKNLFGGTNSYPWSPTVTTGIRGISITPYNTDSTRIYSYDIFVELVSACDGALQKITRDLSAEVDLDDGTGGATEIATFSY